jgi:hypothetical protein
MSKELREYSHITFPWIKLHYLLVDKQNSLCVVLGLINVSNACLGVVSAMMDPYDKSA